jgi:outer membrane protein
MLSTIYKKFKIIFPLLILGFLICGPLTVSAFAADSRIGFLNIQKAVSSTKDWKSKFNKFKADFTKEKKRINLREKKLKKMLENLNKQSYVLDPSLKKKKEDEFRKEKIEFERYVQDQNAEFGKKEKEMTQKILIKMVDVVKKIGKEKKYTMIVEEKFALYHEKSIDITGMATRAYDKANK